MHLSVSKQLVNKAIMFIFLFAVVVSISIILALSLNILCLGSSGSDLAYASYPSVLTDISDITDILIDAVSLLSSVAVYI